MRVEEPGHTLTIGVWHSLHSRIAMRSSKLSFDLRLVWFSVRIRCLSEEYANLDWRNREFSYPSTLYKDEFMAKYQSAYIGLLEAHLCSQTSVAIKLSC